MHLAACTTDIDLGLYFPNVDLNLSMILCIVTRFSVI